MPAGNSLPPMTADRHAMNRAFHELGLRFQWDERDWAVLSTLPDVRSQLAYWLPRWRDLGLEFVTIDEAVSTPAT